MKRKAGERKDKKILKLRPREKKTGGRGNGKKGEEDEMKHEKRKI